MTAGVDQAVVNAIAAWAEQHWQIRSVHFFGSRVRGNPRPESDLDIAIELVFDEADSALGHWMFLRSEWATDLSMLVDHVLDLQWMHKQATPNVCAAVNHADAQVFVRGPRN